MLRVVLTGGPGAGKTAVLNELRSRGYGGADDSARAYIAERRSQGLSPRPELLEFASEVLRRDIVNYSDAGSEFGVTFFDRGVVDSLGMLNDIAPMDEERLRTCLQTYRFHKDVFILPPWQAIYANDSERDQTFSEAQGVFERVVKWYRQCDYHVLEVPPMAVPMRVDYVLQSLGCPYSVNAPRGRGYRPGGG